MTRFVDVPTMSRLVHGIGVTRLIGEPKDLFCYTRSEASRSALRRAA